MTSTIPTNILPDLGDPEALRGASRAFTGHCNAHIHLPPNFSAFQTVEQAVALAASEQIAVLGVSNYYDYTVYGEFAARAAAASVFPLFGIELLTMQEDLRVAGVKVNDPGNPGKTYLCGKGITRFAPDTLTSEAARLLAQIRKCDAGRMAQMIGKLAALFAQRGVASGLDHEAVIDRVVRRHGSARQTVHLQERHAAQAFQEVLFETVSESQRAAAIARVLGLEHAPDVGHPHASTPVTVQNDIRSHLMKAGKPAFVEEGYIAFEDAITLVRELGGIPCYPVLADGTHPICGFEESPEALIANLQRRGIFAAEFIPVRNTPDVLARYVNALWAAGLVVTAGTEHNTLDLIPLRPSCVKGASIPDDVQAVFREGACVVAAHQYLTLRGRPGFTGGHEQIAAFAQLGAAVIHAYRQQAAALP